jgi:hypothetical protein
MRDRADAPVAPAVETTLVHAHGIAALVTLLISVTFGVVASLQFIHYKSLKKPGSSP